MSTDLKLQFHRDRWNRQGKVPSAIAAAQMVHQGKPVDCYDGLAAEYAERLDLQPTDRVLEVGCGSGCLLLRIKPLVAQIVGTDFSPGMLTHLEGQGVEYHCCEAASLPFPDESFDKVFLHGVFQYFPDEEYTRRVMDELLRVCKSGGRLLIGGVLNSLLRDEYNADKIRCNYGGIRRLLYYISAYLVQPIRSRLRYGAAVDSGPLFLSPFFFKGLFEGSSHAWLPFLETVDAKPAPYLRFRYDVLVHKDGRSLRCEQSAA